MKPPRMVDEYIFPELYDAEYGHYTADIPFFLKYVEASHALDLACGTGRITIALARAGVSCIGMDTNQAMLDLARAKSQGLPIFYQLRDMRSFDLGQKFDLITLAGNSFQALLTDDDQEKLFSCLKQHLNPNGKFIFNSRNPTPEATKSYKAYILWHTFVDNKGDTVQVFGNQTYDTASNLMQYTTRRIWPGKITETPLILKFTDSEAIQSKITQTGLKIESIFGDWDMSPYHTTSENIIIVGCL